MTAQQKRKLDEERKQYLESLGYYVTVVWESDMEEFIGTLK
jgi:G:T-mismatch repair DNA endonuclease (very short patch repair protein)